MGATRPVKALRSGGALHPLGSWVRAIKRPTQIQEARKNCLPLNGGGRQGHTVEEHMEW
jgi:hypothetical protein